MTARLKKYLPTLLGVLIVFAAVFNLLNLKNEKFHTEVDWKKVQEYFNNSPVPDQAKIVIGVNKYIRPHALSINAIFKSEKAKKEIVEFYSNYLMKHGWTLKAKWDDKQFVYYTYCKDDISSVISINKDKDINLYNYSVSWYGSNVSGFSCP